MIIFENNSFAYINDHNENCDIFQCEKHKPDAKINQMLIGFMNLNKIDEINLVNYKENNITFVYRNSEPQKLQQMYFYRFFRIIHKKIIGFLKITNI